MTETRYCDVVMKGGVTSGIVYPPAICALAEHYQLCSIGGTSVGAIAAAIAAAAEYRRRVGNSGDGYLLLSRLPQFLKQPKVLLKLFGADRAKSVSLMRIALRFIGSQSLLVRTACALGVATLTYWWIVLPVLAILGFVLATASAAAWPADGSVPTLVWHVAAYVLVPIVVWLFAVVFVPLSTFVVHCVTVLATNDFGWCHAFEATDAKRFAADLATLDAAHKDVADLTVAQTPRLFDWLDAFIAQTAGRDRSQPLTFGDLARAEPIIDFRMITTCLTLGRPFGIPFDPGDSLMLKWDDNFKPGARNLYFLKSDFEKYFPPGIVAHMTPSSALDAAKTYRVNGADEPMYRFPDPTDLPIIVGVRFSMSFPVLFCAIRLFTPAPRNPAVMRPLWFTDGGLSSNFPIHLFDNPLPSRPTFALDLLGGGSIPPAPSDRFVEYDERVTTVETQHDIDKGRPIARVLAMASAMIDAMRTWQDAVLGALPGNSSRTVGVRLPPAEGGINLNMDSTQVEDLILRGTLAGDLLVKNFVSSSDAEAPGWLQQRWLRYLATMATISSWLTGCKRGALSPANAQDAQPYLDLAASNYVGSPTAPRPELDPQLANASAAGTAVAATQAILDVPISPETTDMFEEVAPAPVGELHIRPPA